MRYSPAAATLALAALAGCGSPSAANIELRKQNQALQSELATLKLRHAGDEATITSLQSHATTVPSLPAARVERLFTAHGIRLGRLTLGEDFDPARPGDEGLKVSVIPFDEDGDALKAAGAVTIEAYDLAAPQAPLVGRWAFDADQARRQWFGKAMLYEYVFCCRWEKPPAHAELTVKVTFVDELTGRQFAAQRVVTVRLPPPASATPAGGPS